MHFISVLFFPALFLSCTFAHHKIPVDRYALVTRHNISNPVIDSLGPLTVGNGDFAYTADITGMQSFPGFYENGIPLGTQSQWGWHSFPNPENYSLTDVYKNYKAGNDSVPYPYQFTNDPESRKYKASQWLRENPHRIHLGLIGLEISKNDSQNYVLSEIKHPLQKLNLWKGEILSYFEIDGIPVEVITYCHQDRDMVAFRIKSDLLKSGKLTVKIQFPYPTHEKFSSGCNFNDPEKHTTRITDSLKNGAILQRVLDAEKYYVKLEWNGKAGLFSPENHLLKIVPSDARDFFELTCCFSEEKITDNLPTFSDTKKNNQKKWQNFWESGAAVDFSACTDPRAFELERRVILSQYLTRIQCTGSLPPQETGLTYNSWYGKFHMEMHWWHAVHFILWNRADLINKQMEYYFNIANQAEHTARLQGYDGARWPKMVGPDGRESPSTIGPFLIWQQPHIIYFAELLYRNGHRKDSILKKYSGLVFKTADFMVSYARWDSLHKRYILGPPLIPAQERFNPETTINPPFELAYWYWALQTAQKWRERSGLQPDTKWQQVIDHLAELPVKDGLYLFSENAQDCWINSLYLTDHPIVLGISGLLPETAKVDTSILHRTLDEVLEKWDWHSCWGWDFPLAAMNAASLHDPDLAVDLLLMDTPKNRYLANGHNYQDKVLSVYLPGNGGLLAAVAMMCALKNEDGTNGFPSDGTWNVKYEKLFPLHE